MKYTYIQYDLEKMTTGWEETNLLTKRWTILLHYRYIWWWLLTRLWKWKVWWWIWPFLAPVLQQFRLLVELWSSNWEEIDTKVGYVEVGAIYDGGCVIFNSQICDWKRRHCESKILARSKWSIEVTGRMFLDLIDRYINNGEVWFY